VGFDRMTFSVVKITVRRTEMKNVYSLLARVVLLLVLIIGTVSILLADIYADEFESDASPKCDCYYPNSLTWGVKKNNDCNKVECWVDLFAE
jgi:hypothetical protein